MNSFLDIQNLSVSFGGLKAIKSINLSLAQGELMAIIGPNGAGKTTFFNLLTGVYTPTEGHISFLQNSIEGQSLDDINKLGIARTFQNIRLFPSLSVMDNVRVASYQNLKQSLLSSLLGTKSTAAENNTVDDEVNILLEQFSLDDKKDELALNLSYGERRKLEIVRALATKPKLLLLDEPAAGMNSTEKNTLSQLIKQIHSQFNLAIILIEHDMKLVMNLVPRIMVLDYGEVLAEGCPDEIKKNKKVIEAYLGVQT